MRKSSTRLADGREIIWFDRDGGASRDPDSVHDIRDLPRVVPASQLRFDELLEEWVTIAAHRQDRTYQPASRTAATTPARTCACTRSAGPRTRSNTLPGRRPGQGAFVSDVLPEAVAQRLRGDT